MVNYATGGFVKGQERLVASCRALGQDVACYGVEDRFTPHSEIPYFFKCQALLEAAKRALVLLWADASVFASGGGPLEPVFEYIEREGYYLQNQGWNNAQWCHDRALAAFGYTRDEAETQCQVLGGFWGVSLLHPTGRLLLEELVKHSDLFKGEWSNTRKTESLDARCLGHRHDQSVMSLLAAKHGLKTPWPEEHYWCHYDRNSQYLFNIEGCT